MKSNCRWQFEIVKARPTVAALQRLALARVAVCAGSARWSTGGPVAAAVAELPFVASRTTGAPDHSLLLEVLHAFGGLPEAAPLVVARHATQPAEHLAQDLARNRAAAAANAAAATVAAATVAALAKTAPAPPKDDDGWGGPAATKKPRVSDDDGWGGSGGGAPPASAAGVEDDDGWGVSGSSAAAEIVAAAAYRKRKLGSDGDGGKSATGGAYMVCADCGVRKPKGDFSKGQRKVKNRGHPRCRDCMDAKEAAGKIKKANNKLEKRKNSGGSATTGNSWAAQELALEQKEAELAEREKAVEAMAAHAIDSVNVALFRQEQLQREEPPSAPDVTPAPRSSAAVVMVKGTGELFSGTKMFAVTGANDLRQLTAEVAANIGVAAASSELRDLDGNALTGATFSLLGPTVKLLVGTGGGGGAAASDR